MATGNGYLFAGSYGDGVFRSSDNGDNWIQVNNGLAALFVLSFSTTRVATSLQALILAMGFSDQPMAETVGTKKITG